MTMTRSKLRKLRHSAKIARKNPNGVRIAPRATALPLASAIFACMSVAHADTPTSAGTLEEVIVTAQKRTESLQNVPLSITAMGTQKLDELHVQNFNDYIKYLPSVSYQTLGPGFAKIYMRGVSSGGDGNHSGSLPSVGVYLDEQPITTIQGPLDIHVYDIARVEALAGPQGTLYGASSEAGTIRIITNKPEFNEFKGGYDLQGNTVKHGDPGYSGEGFVNIPLGSAAAIRLVGWYEKEGGYIDNVPGSLTFPNYAPPFLDSNPTGAGYGFTNDNRSAPATPATDTRYYGTAKKAYNDVETFGGRAALRLALNDNWTITPVFQGQQTTSNGIFATEETKHPDGYAGLYPTLGDLQVQHYNPENSLDHWGQASLTVEGKISNFDLTYAGGFIRRNDVTHSDYTDYTVGYAVYYQQPRGYFYDNAGNAINPTQEIQGRDGYKMFSHELRVQTPRDLPVRATVGGFIQHQEHDILQRYTIAGLADAESVPDWANTYWLTKELRINRDSAAFGEVNWDITSQFNLLGGLRYYTYKNSLQGWYGFASYVTPNLPAGRTGCPTPDVRDSGGGPCQNLFRVTDGSGTTPKITATFKFDDQRLIYATYSKGFRPGGVNRSGATATYEADTLKNYEIGWKTSWFDNHLRFNGAIFQEDWKNFQFGYLGPNSVTIIKNAGSARIRGIETSVDWAATDDLTFGSGFSLMDPKLTANFCKYPTAAGGIQTSTCNEYDSDGAFVATHPFGAPSGQQLPTTPKFKANLTARYGFGLFDWKAHAQGSLVYQSAVWPDMRTEERAILGQQPAYAIFDATFGADHGPYSVELFVNNVFDRRAEVFRYAECTESTCGAYAVYHGIYKPRLIGVKFAQKF
jgi:outer membrane receptor protein involved in Fe transport